MRQKGVEHTMKRITYQYVLADCFWPCRVESVKAVLKQEYVSGIDLIYEVNQSKHRSGSAVVGLACTRSGSMDGAACVCGRLLQLRAGLLAL
jgi:hypothetical protein